jgi:CNT family concentrative nucleoside transporter
MGVPWSEAATVGSLVGVKTVLNEFIAYIQLSSMPPEALSERTRLITIYALCGFANFASVGIQIGGIGAMCPERKLDLANLAMPALLAATLGTCMSAAVVGIVAG